MDKLLIFLIIIFTIFIIGFYPFSVNIKTYFNPLKNKNFIYVKFGILNLVCVMIQYQKSKILITNKKGKTKELIIKVPSQFQQRFVVNLINLTDLRGLFVVFKGGVKEDAFKTSILCGSVSSFCCAVFNFLKYKFNPVINYKIDTNYKEDCLTFGFDSKIKISFFSVIIAFFKSVLVKGVNYGKRRKSNSKYFS